MTEPRSKRESRSDTVYKALRDELMTGALAPEERLGEERLAERYGVSRTPVREALARLQADGLVERHDAGLFPYRPRLDTLGDYYELRITLEVQGIARVLDDPELGHDRAVLGPEIDRWRAFRTTPPDPDAGFVDADEQFHTVLLDSSGNHALTDALKTVNARIRPVRMFDYLTPDRMLATIEEHIAIGEAVLDRDLTGARAQLLAHIDQSRRVVADRAGQVLQLTRLARATKT